MHRSLYRRHLQQAVSQIHLGEAEVEEGDLHVLFLGLRPVIWTALLRSGLSW